MNSLTSELIMFLIIGLIIAAICIIPATRKKQGSQDRDVGKGTKAVSADSQESRNRKQKKD